MKSFLKEVIEYVYKEHKGFDDIVFVLPSKRAGVFLKQHISSFINKPVFLPKIYSIENLIADISGLEIASNLELLLLLYEASLLHLEREEQNFESFISWGGTLLSDFNEIDRNLVDYTSLFEYLTADQRLKNWGVDKRASPLVSNTVRFWSQLHHIYAVFKSKLLDKGIGHQGLIYREAVRRLHSYLIQNTTVKKFYFVGFNALNIAEERIVQAFIDSGKSTVLWDIDSSFLEDDIHEVGFFIRKYLKRWPQTKILSNAESSFLKKGAIEITGVPKSLSQAKFVGKLLKNTINENNSQNIALVLSDESLLQPILNSLPEIVEKVNITMGLPLRKTTLFSFFNSLFNLYIKKSKNGWFYKDVHRVLSNPHCICLLNTSKENIAHRLNLYAREKNILFITDTVLEREPFSTSDVLKIIFKREPTSGKAFVKTCLHVIQVLRKKYEVSNTKELHQLYGYFQLFNRLDSILDSKPYLNSLKALKFLFNDLVSNEQIDFKGEPLGGLQIMGVLESRTLDFETVILTSVNEGILPAGKNQNSFIPYAIKKEFGLPTYKEKDAIYTYHFYRLLQRAKNVHILYNTEPDVLMGNERSRFISQLLMDSTIAEKVKHTVASPDIKIAVSPPKKILKTPELIYLLQEVSRAGFSPTSLTNYIKDPYTFYKRNILRLKEEDNVEENIAYNTFGTIVHDSLEELYLPLIQQDLSPENLSPLKKRIAPVTKSHFEKYFPPKDVESGQNLIAFHVVQKYLSSLIDFDISRSKTNKITLIALEENLKTRISLPGNPYPVFLKGKLDRLERVDGTLQILDYKTGNALLSEVELINLEECLTHEKRAKAFQLLCYALMMDKHVHSMPYLAGIVPIKKINSGLLLFAKKNNPRGPKNHIIDKGLLDYFEKLLANLILEILNPEIPFMEKESASF